MSKKLQEVQAATAPETKETDTAIVVAPQGGELVVASSLDAMFEEDAGAGLQNLGANDFALAFVTVLQKGSPQVSKANAKYIKGAEQGMIFNTVSQELYDGDEGISVIPCGCTKSVVEWKSRDSGGGLVAHHREGDPFLKTCARNERGQLVVPESGNICVDTAYHFILLVKESGFPEYAVISMYSTGLKVSRNWNTSMRAIMKRGKSGIYNPPTYSHSYRLKTVAMTKDSYDWFQFSVTTEAEITDPDTFKIAREFARQVEAGAVKISAPPSEFDEAAVNDPSPF
jgi:hypothetical protein